MDKPFELFLARAFGHYPDKGFGAGSANQDPAVFTQDVFRFADGGGDIGVLLPAGLAFDPDIDKQLREAGHHRRQIRQFSPGPGYGGNKLHGGQHSDAGGAVLAEDNVAGLLAAQAVATRRIPNDVGLVVALESTGYSGEPSARKAQIIPGWSVEKAKRMGAAAIKLLVYYHPDSPASAEIEEFTKKVADDCLKSDIVLMLEPLSYSLDENKKLSSAEKRYVVVETAKRLTPLGVDILKAEFPLDVAEKDESQWAKACADISTASVAPWILLSAAVDYETYLRQVVVACNSGASGIAVGRAVW